MQILPDIPWNENEHSCVWKLIVEISTKANYKVLFGKKKPAWGESEHIQVTTNSECYEIDPAATGDHIKSKLESLHFKLCFGFADPHILILDSPKSTRNMLQNSEWWVKVSMKIRTMMVEIPMNFAGSTLVQMAQMPIAQRKLRTYGVRFNLLTMSLIPFTLFNF